MQPGRGHNVRQTFAEHAGHLCGVATRCTPAPVDQAKHLLRTLGILTLVFGVLTMVGAVMGELPPIGGMLGGGTLEADTDGAESESLEGEAGEEVGASETGSTENAASENGSTENSASENGASEADSTDNTAGAPVNTAEQLAHTDTPQVIDDPDLVQEIARLAEASGGEEVRLVELNGQHVGEGDIGSETLVSAISALAGIRRYRVCDNAGGGAAISTGDILGDARLETLVACDRVVHILGDLDGELLRIGRVQLGAGTGSARPATPVVADLTGDGTADLVLGFATLDRDGSPNGGALAVAIGSPYGGIGSARILAPIPATHVVAAPLLSDGIDLAALNWTDNHGRRPSEVWVFSGGPSPARRGRLTLSGQGFGLNTGDMNNDGRMDLLAIDDSGLRTISGPQFRAVDEASGGASALLRGDVNGDGQADTIVKNESGLTLYLSGSQEGASIEVDGVPRHAALGDVNGDDQMDLVTATARWLRVLTRNANGFSELSSSPLPSLADVEAIAIARPYAVLLLKSGNHVEVVRLPLGRRGEVDESATATPVRDSPLVLNVTIE